MRLLVALFAVLGATVVSSLPAYETREPGKSCAVEGPKPVFDYEVKILIKGSSARAATLFKKPHFDGVNEGTDVTAIQTWYDSCQIFEGWYGGWDKAARSIVVEKGFKCVFFTNADCKGTPVLQLGDKKRFAVLGQLPKEADGTLRSAKCPKF
ncbi:hypothetical protein P154DRAFT_579728 [Amniculicola lignicola CBS 123094]|uniref:Uncharacterized protein n=1 Tax=Amniculicola lignicola CBS 123094 TaxID=1392246 RepID=A0A6A5W791_9PLEO|nr:hypothetical protein P154DRAFT_579728 [Amniculicola lignicola CBS 123094]